MVHFSNGKQTNRRLQISKWCYLRVRKQAVGFECAYKISKQSIIIEGWDRGQSVSKCVYYFQITPTIKRTQSHRPITIPFQTSDERRQTFSHVAFC